ncbi:Disease resistance protein RGA2 [Vitis vinifera]|uniref:Disease resistance protein RGA2 n=1 Tax=Vitis vinifera TaxID=29760 RepID=A0A438I9Y0_VITVI|nr:Disease resistance protein RGA2 [Vitis vinifera]
MAEQIPFNIIADVLTKLGSSAIQQIGSAFGVAKELTKLTEKLDAIRGVLLDAEEKQEKSHAVKTWVRRLKDVVYDADDLLDDFATHQLQRGGVARQVSDFFSSSNQLVYRFKMSSRVKNIKEEVDEIVKEIDLLKLVQGNIVHREVESSWRETHSFVLTSEMVERDEDKEEIIKLLVSSGNEKIFLLLPLLELGGWARPLLLSWQQRYLLVLDDVWNDDFQNWDRLRTLLMVGAKGSLKENQSWNLFSKIAFEEGQERMYPRLVGIGKEIVNMCNGVPLIIKTLGAILRFKTEERPWLSIRNNENLLLLEGGNNDRALSVLKLSYDDLSFHLKQCFAYCAIFPKDYEIEKKLLVQLWMAQGYIQASYVGDRHLENDRCESLSYMPCGIGRLTLLESLPLFVIGTGSKVGRLSELKRLNNLRGKLWIKKLENVRDANVESEEANLGEKQYIESLELEWSYGEEAQAQSGEDAESVMVGLRPHRNLKEFFITGYGGRGFPSWMMNGGLSCRLPNLSTINLKSCLGCQILPPFVELPHLKSLKLQCLEKVEYMDHCSSEGPFFPSLEYLELERMPKLKELWRRDLSPTHPPSFPCLLELTLTNCDKLASLELHSSPLLSKLEIKECHKLTSLRLPSPIPSQLNIRACPRLFSPPSPPPPPPPPPPLFITDRSLNRKNIRYCGDLASLELHSSPLLSSLDIRNCPQLTSLLFPPSPCLEKLYLCKVKEVVLRELMLATASSLESVSVESIDDLMSLPDELRQHVSTLQTLKIWDCSRLATIPRWIGNLTSLTELGIGYCPELTSLAQEMRSLTNLRSLSIDYSCGLASSPNWIGGLTSLTDLEICSYSQLTSLPKELRSLGILKSLTIHDWSGLTTLPDWIGSLTSLTDLEIGPCPALTITARGIVLF